MAITPKELRDPKFFSHEKNRALGANVIPCRCARCNEPAAIFPGWCRERSMGIAICTACDLVPLSSRALFTVAMAGGSVYLDADPAYARTAGACAHLEKLGLLEHTPADEWEITTAGLAMLWLKEHAGWEREWDVIEIESAHPDRDHALYDLAPVVVGSTIGVLYYASKTDRTTMEASK